MEGGREGEATGEEEEEEDLVLQEYHSEEETKPEQESVMCMGICYSMHCTCVPARVLNRMFFMATAVLQITVHMFQSEEMLHLSSVHMYNVHVYASVRQLVCDTVGLCMYYTDPIQKMRLRKSM